MGGHGMGGHGMGAGVVGGLTLWTMDIPDPDELVAVKAHHTEAAVRHMA